ncbi:MAG: DUF5666 domain-containing protein, partial [bacterium]
SEDRAFSRQDTLYIIVSSPDIDFTNLNESDYKLHPHSDTDELRGHLTNHSDGSYTAKISLSNSNPSQSFWELEVEINDHAGNEFRSNVAITITADGNPPIAGTGEPIEVRGFISEILTDQIVVNGLTFNVDGQTDISGKDHQSLALADLKVGLQVEVKALTQNDSSLLAIRIKLEDEKNKENIEVKGFVKFVGQDSLVVDGLVFFVDANTDIRDRDGNTILLSGIVVGAFVEVKGRLNVDGTLLADRIREEDDDGSAIELELKGFVEEITDSTITIAGKTFSVDSLAKILDRDKLPLLFSQLQVGTFVEVKGKFRADGLLWVVRIKIKNASGTEVELKGVVEALSQTEITVKGMVFSLDSATVFLDHSRNPSDISTLQVGQFVEVKARRQPDGSLRAVRIKLEDDHENEVELKGAIVSITGNSITLFNVTFVIDSTTEILDNLKNPITLADLQVGMIVEAKGKLGANGTVLAKRIKIEDHANDEIEIKGTIEALRTDGLTVAGHDFGVNDKTIVLNREKQAIAFTDLQVGLFVEIKARRQPDGSLLAVRIKLEDQGGIQVKLRGSITSISGDTVVVESVAFLTDAATQFLGHDNSALVLSDFNVGDFVEAESETLAGGLPVLKKLKKENFVALQGQIQGVSNSQFTILAANIVFDANTFIAGSFNQSADASEIVAGTQVLVRGSVSGSGEVLASSVIITSSTVTGIETPDTGLLPADFVLEQNYPNPFNPRTTLLYRIRSATPQRVVLRIYNLLGQEV